MYFKKLEISGFKSFADKTVLHFEPGITAIVGPNGCGKSNVFDSMRWCLGEQSIKSLRGSRMEDVIFNGTESVPAQSATEVSLTLSNEAKILAIDYDEVTITRRLFRSGESEYLINNNTVRLKDINDLLMGTGIGAESYSLVEQGKIDLVISSKPEDRRLVFDEATGVSKYKAKKREALKKLEETDNNLLRVNDIITEVKRQIGSIERQAGKARRYKEIFEKLKAIEIQYSSLELKSLKSELTMMAEMTKKSVEDEQGLSNQLQELDKKLILQEKQLQEIDQQLSGLKDTISDFENTNIRDQQHINLNKERISDLNKHADILSSQKQELAAKIAGHEKNIAELTTELASFNQVYSKKEEELVGKEKDLGQLVQAIETAQNEIKSLKADIFELSAAETRINNQLNENASLMHTSLSRQKRLEIEKTKTESESVELLKNLGDMQSGIVLEKNKINDIAKTLSVLKEEKASLENSLKSLEEALRGLENEKLGLRSQIEFLKELKLKYDSMPGAKDGIFEISEIPQEKITGIIAHARAVEFQQDTKTYRVRCEFKFISFDLENLESKIAEISKEIESHIRQMSEKEKILMDSLKKIQETEDAFQQEKIVLTNKEAVLSNLSDNSKRILDELSLITIELSEVSEAYSAAKVKESGLKNELEAIKSQNLDIEKRINDDTNEIGRNSQNREHVLVVIAQLKTELSNQKAKADSLESNLNFFKTAHSDDSRTLNSNDAEIQSSLDKIQELNNEALALELDIHSREQEIKSKTKELSRLSSIRTEEVNGLDFTKKQIIDLEEKTEKIKEDNHRYQMQEQELNFRYTGIKNRILQSYNVDLDEIPPAEETTQAPDMEAMPEEIAALKEKVESFGTVNLVAIEELEELKNRHDFLNQQHNDLLLAKDSLQKAILKINRTTRKMFLETFQIVAEEFKNHFKLLFGGGEARLFLIDEEDVLESGIEIICRPPGKKLQNITLLSGGEKALSAIALIFAIFKTKPSPFCVLDEIDAALDESNIDRFSRMLLDFSKTSQFIVITHNKKTILRANVMYGVTMENSGISKIVSVKLHDNGNTKDQTPPQKDQPPLETAQTN